MKGYEIMAKRVGMFWIIATAILTVILLTIVFPLLSERYGLLEAILLGLVLIVGMSLYDIRGAWVSRKN